MRTKIVSLTLGIVCALLALDIALRLVGGLYSQRHAPKTDGSPGRRHTVLCIGDSFTMGYGADPRDSYPRQLQALLDQRFGETVAVVNAGMGYQNSSEALEKVRKGVEKLRPAVVLVLTGTNNGANYHGYWRRSVKSRMVSGFRDYIETMPLVRLSRLLSKDIVEKKRRNGSNRRISRGDHANGRAKNATMDNGKEETKPAVSNSEHAEKGWTFFRNSNFAAAIACFRAGIENNPNDASCLSGLGCSYYHQARYKEALYYLVKGGEAGPKESDYYFNVGLVYLGMERFPEAMNTFMQGIRQAPEKENNMNYDGIGILIKACKSDALLAEIKKNLTSISSKNAKLSSIRNMLDTCDAGEFNQRIRQWIKRDLKEMVDLCAAKNIRIILQNYPHTEMAGDVSEEVARECKVDFIDHASIFRVLFKKSPRDRYLIGDGHCNREGYGVMAATVFQKIVQLGIFKE